MSDQMFILKSSDKQSKQTSIIMNSLDVFDKNKTKVKINM
jgi:hypothetical protein